MFSEWSVIFICPTHLPRHLFNKVVTRTLAIIASYMYRQVSNIRRTLVGNKIVYHSDVVEASPVGTAPTTSSLST